MKKLGIILLSLVPSLCYADTVHLAKASLTSQDSMSGYALSYTGTFKGRYALKLEYGDASKDQVSVSSTSVSFTYGFKPFATGSTYLSLGSVDIDNQTVLISSPIGQLELDSSGASAFAAIGYTKFSGQGLDYDFSLVTRDGESSVNASLRGAIEGTDWGWVFGIADNDGGTGVSAGVSVIF
ncbi:MAG: hypothetical protein P8I13_07115 [Porticoccaceae bacterium]|nr:hypothetical protein [Porticoccaceae bacterium]